MLNPIRIGFQHIADQIDPTVYINAKLDLLLHAYENQEAYLEQPDDNHLISLEHRTALVRLVAASQLHEPQLASNNQHPAMDENQQLIAGQRITCAVNTIQILSPLLPEEVLESQEQSYLEAEYLGYPPRTGVIRQVTNMATLYFFFLDCHIEQQGDVTWVPPRDKQQKNLLSAAIDQLPYGCDHKALLQKKLAEGSKQIIPIPFNSLAITPPSTSSHA